MKNKITSIIILIAVCTVLLPFIAHADPPPMEGDPGEVPIDGGISMLIGAGVAYGVQKLRKKNKEK